MKKSFLITLIVVLAFGVCSIHAQVIKKSVHIDGKTYMAIIFTDKDGLHIQYFSDNVLNYLGEEIFKNGEKVFDTFKLNDGVKDIHD